MDQLHCFTLSILLNLIFRGEWDSVLLQVGFSFGIRWGQNNWSLFAPPIKNRIWLGANYSLCPIPPPQEDWMIGAIWTTRHQLNGCPLWIKINQLIKKIFPQNNRKVRKFLITFFSDLKKRAKVHVRNRAINSWCQIWDSCGLNFPI